MARQALRLGLGALVASVLLLFAGMLVWPIVLWAVGFGLLVVSLAAAPSDPPALSRPSEREAKGRVLPRVGTGERPSPWRFYPAARNFDCPGCGRRVWAGNRVGRRTFDLESGVP